MPVDRPLALLACVWPPLGECLYSIPGLAEVPPADADTFRVEAPDEGASIICAGPAGGASALGRRYLTLGA